LDKWVLARANQTVRDVTDGLDAYRVTESARLVAALIDDLSTWWLRRSRDRFKEETEDKTAAMSVLRDVLLVVAKLMAPFAPFFAEDLYLRVRGPLESVHLEAWPAADAEAIDADSLGSMARTRSVVSKLLEARANAGKNVRQPLASATVTLPEGELGAEYVELVKDEVNVKDVTVKMGEYAVGLDVALTPALVREGTAREIVRRANAMRKNAGLTIDDRIDLYVESPDAQAAEAVAEHTDAIASGTLATGVRTAGDRPKNAETFRANEFEITVGFDVVG
jgi:isoleucyl-tRNA synthetase